MRAVQGRTLRSSIGAAVIVAFGSWCGGRPALADGPVQVASQRPSVAQSPIMIAVATSKAEPASKSLLQSLRSHPWLAANADRFKVVEVPVESQAMSGRSGANAATAVFAYRQGPRGPEMLGGWSGFEGASDVVQWIRSLEPRDGTLPKRDTYLTQTGNDNSLPVPSQQGYAPPAAVPTPFTPASVPQQVMVPQVTMPAMTYMAPAAMTTANVVQAPAQSFVIQQPPAQLFFQQQAQAPVFAAQVAMPAAVTAPSNIFMPSGMVPAAVPSGMQVASIPMTTTSVASVAPASMVPTGFAPVSLAPAGFAPAGFAPAGFAPAAVAAAATAPAVGSAALTTQSVSVPASSTTSRVRVRGPGPLAAAAARLGERLTTLGRTRIETVQETRLETQGVQSPPGQFMTLSSVSASPVMPPHQNVTFPASVPQPPPSPAQPPTPSYEQPPQPSPQGSHEKGHWFWQKN